MLGFYDYTVVLTYLSLAFSLTGIFNCLNGNVFYAIICLLISGLCDMFDGKVARSKKNRTADEKSFGIQIDSLADLVAFGVLPSVIGYSLGIKGIFCVVLIFFPLAALIRLAYFNVLELSKKQGDPSGYIGLPVTTSSLIFPLIYGLKEFFPNYLSEVYCVFLLITGILFISKFKLKKPGLKALLFMLFVGILELILLIM